MRKLKKLFALLRHSSYRRGLHSGVGAAIEHAAFLRTRTFATVVDAGANKGQFALAVRAAMPNARIIAFEPLSKPAAIFRTVFSRDSNVSLLPVALGSTKGNETIHVSHRADSSSLLPIGALQSEIFPGTEEQRTETIRVETLDDILTSEHLEAPVLLKIDVQGFELELLKGAVKSLALFDSVYVELSFARLYDGQPLADEVVEWLREHNFKLAGVYNLAPDAKGRTVQADFHFRQNL